MDRALRSHSSLIEADGVDDGRVVAVFHDKTGLQALSFDENDNFSRTVVNVHAIKTAWQAEMNQCLVESMQEKMLGFERLTWLKISNGHRDASAEQSREVGSVS